MLVSLEVGGLIHIEPNPREGDQAIQTVQLALPIGAGIRVEIVHKMYLAWPHSCQVMVVDIFDAFEKYSCLHSGIGRHLVQYTDSDIDQRHVVDILALQQRPHFGRRVAGLIDCKNRLRFHVVQVRPHCVKGQTQFIELFHHFGELVKVFVAPSALVVAERPKRGHMGWADKMVILLQQFLGVAAVQNDEVDVATRQRVFNVFGVLGSIEVEAIGIFQVNHMVTLGAGVFASEVDRLMAIGLRTASFGAHIDLPWAISIPDGPSSILDGKVFLESFAHTPFLRVIGSCDLNVVDLLEGELIQAEKWGVFSDPSELQEHIFSIHFRFHMAELKSSVRSALEFGALCPLRIHREPGILLVLYRIGDGDAHHVLVFAVDVEVPDRSPILDLVDSIEIIVSVGVLGCAGHCRSDPVERCHQGDQEDEVSVSGMVHSH